MFIFAEKYAVYALCQRPRPPPPSAAGRFLQTRLDKVQGCSDDSFECSAALRCRSRAVVGGCGWGAYAFPFVLPQLKKGFAEARQAFALKNLSFLRSDHAAAAGVPPPDAQRVAAIHIRCGDFMNFGYRGVGHVFLRRSWFARWLPGVLRVANVEAVVLLGNRRSHLHHNDPGWFAKQGLTPASTGDLCESLFERMAASIRAYGLGIPVGIAPEVDFQEDVRFLTSSKLLIQAVPGSTFAYWSGMLHTGEAGFYMPWPQADASPREAASDDEMRQKGLGHLLTSHRLIKTSSTHSLVGFDKTSSVSDLATMRAEYGP